MAKKLSILLAAAVAVLAFAIPAMASAAPTLTNSSGELLSTGSTIVGTGSAVNLQSNVLGAIKCSTITLEGTLNTNDSVNGIAGGNTGQASPPTTDCTNGKNTVNVTNVTLTNLSSTVGGDAFASFTANVDIGASTPCAFTGKNVTGTYANGGNVLTFTESSGEGITSVPSSCGTAKLSGSFVLEQGNGEALKAVF